MIKGSHHTEESKRKNSLAKKGKYIGWHHTKEAKEKIRRYIPDFILPDLNEFVEVGGLNQKKVMKMNEFVKAGNILYYLGEKTKWRIG